MTTQVSSGLESAQSGFYLVGCHLSISAGQFVLEEEPDLICLLLLGHSCGGQDFQAPGIAHPLTEDSLLGGQFTFGETK